MAQFTENDRVKLDETHDHVIRLSTVLLGVEGTKNGGLVRDVNFMKVDVSKLKKYFWLLVGLLLGSGVLGGSLWVAFRG